MKTSMPVEWHEECIKNQIKHCKRKGEGLNELKEEVRRLKEEIEKYALQIIKAKQLKKTSFDRDRFKI